MRSLDPELAETAHVQAAHAALRAADRDGPAPSYQARQQALRALGSVIGRRVPALVAAAAADFGERSSFTTRLGDVATTLRELDYIQKNLRGWMAPQRRRVAWHFRPARARVQAQPLGVVGIIAPWNYPFRLALGPLQVALAAGNRVLLKPSELSPCSSALLQELVSEALSPEQARVVLGGSRAAQAVCALPLDHLFFTGSTRVGREVARAASARLTPVTLELGGKCPVVVHPGARLDYAARRIVAGKLFNAGQTCMAPDHVWVHTSQAAAFTQALAAEIAKQYPTLARNPDYTAIINQHHAERLRSLLVDAERHGATLRVVNPAGETFAPNSRKLPPVLVAKPTRNMALAEAELFGPILPVWTYDDIEQVLATLREQPSPLAVYYFDEDRARCQAFLERTRSGGACINDVMLQSLQDDLPFGGVGESGMGRYHGREGFETFSHLRSTLHQSRFNWAGLLIPPFGPAARRVLDWLTR